METERQVHSKQRMDKRENKGMDRGWTLTKRYIVREVYTGRRKSYFEEWSGGGWGV